VRCPYISHTTITCRVERTSRVVGKTAQHQHESVQHTSSVNFADDGDTQFLTPKLSACPLPYSTQGTPFGLYTTRRDPGGRMRNHLRSWRSDKRELVPRSVCPTSKLSVLSLTHFSTLLSSPIIANRSSNGVVVRPPVNRET
jgi:hypothetical protein